MFTSRTKPERPVRTSEEEANSQRRKAIADLRNEALGLKKLYPTYAQALVAYQKIERDWRRLNPSDAIPDLLPARGHKDIVQHEKSVQEYLRWLYMTPQERRRKIEEKKTKKIAKFLQERLASAEILGKIDAWHSAPIVVNLGGAAPQGRPHGFAVYELATALWLYGSRLLEFKLSPDDPELVINRKGVQVLLKALCDYAAKRGDLSLPQKNKINAVKAHAESLLLAGSAIDWGQVLFVLQEARRDPFMARKQH